MTDIEIQHFVSKVYSLVWGQLVAIQILVLFVYLGVKHLLLNGFELFKNWKIKNKYKRKNNESTIISENK